jgi:hypothetical protein
MMRTLPFGFVIASVFVCSSTLTFAQGVVTNTGAYPFNLFDRDGKCFVITTEPRSLSAMKQFVGVDTNKPIELRLPKLEGVPATYIDNLEKNPQFAPRLKKFPALTKRQREMDGPPSNRSGRLFSDVRPIYQMYDQFIGGGISLSAELYEVDMNGNKIRSPLGALTVAPYGRPPMGKLTPYKHPKADLIKPILVYIDGQYYSVYGDTQVAQHVPAEAYPDSLAALRYAGNPLFACSEELPPALQSCGVGSNGVIWLVDEEGHIAFFSTKTKEFIQEVSTVDGVIRILIPRENLSASLFAFSDAKKVLQEYHVEIGAKPSIATTTNSRSLPAEALQVCYCDREKIVFVTAAAVIVQGAGKEGTRATHVEMTDNEQIIEGVYLPQLNKVCLLLAKKPKNEDYPNEIGRSWQTMRTIQLSL